MEGFCASTARDGAPTATKHLSGLVEFQAERGLRQYFGTRFWHPFKLFWYSFRLYFCKNFANNKMMKPVDKVIGRDGSKAILQNSGHNLHGDL